MRIRSIKPELWTDAVSGEWGAALTLFFVGTWGMADDVGRLRLDPRLIRAELDPFDKKFGGVAGISWLLEELIRAGRVLPYEAGGQRLGVIANFAKHQRINRPTPSRLPPPPEGLTEGSVSPHGGLAEDSPPEQGREQGAWSLGGEQGDADATPPPAAAPPLPTRDELLDRQHPATARLLDALAAVGIPMCHARAREDRDAVEQLVGPVELSDAVDAVSRSYQKTPKGWIGWHRDCLAELAAVRRDRPGATAPLPDPGCTEWGRLRAALQERLGADVFAHVRDLVGRMDGAALVLAALDRYRRDFVEENYRGVLADEARGLGIAADVRIVGPEDVSR